MTQSQRPYVHLDDICLRVTDGTHQSPQFEQTGVPFLVISDVASGRIEWSGVSKWVSQETYEANTARCRPERGDVLYTAVGSFGVAVPVEADAPFMFQRHIAHIKPDHRRVDTRFLTHILNSPAIRAVAERVAKGAAQRTVTLGDQKKFEFQLPSLAEQKRIAAILDKAVAVKRKRQEAIRLTEELLRAAFLEMFGDPVTNPKGWPVKRLDELTDDERGISYGVVQRGAEVADGVPVTRISNFADNTFDCATVVRTASEIANQYKRTFLRGGELVVSIRGTCGRVAVVPSEAAGWNVSREVAVVPLRAEAEANAHFVRRVALSPGGQNFILGNVRGIAQRGINLADLRNLPIPMPPRSEMRRFDKLREYHESYSSRVRRCQIEHDTLADSLIQCAFSGRL